MPQSLEIHVSATLEKFHAMADAISCRKSREKWKERISAVIFS